MLIKRLAKNECGDFVWIDGETFVNSNKRNVPTKDPTIDQHIAEHGGIFSHADCKTYTTKSSYLDSLKAQGKTIMDW